MIQRIKEFLFGEPQVSIEVGSFYRMRHIIVYPDLTARDSSWIADCPSLPGCLGFGYTKEDAIEDIRKQIDLYIKDLLDEDLFIPRDVKPEIYSV